MPYKFHTKRSTSHKKKSPFIPISSQEIIESVHQAYELGITLVHLHARDEDEKNSNDKNIYATIIEGIRKNCPDLVIGVSLSGRFTKDLEKRSEVLELMPDMASLTLSSLNFMTQESINSPDTINYLIEKMDFYGVKPELECFDSGMINYANYLIKKDLLKAPYYFNLLFGNIFNAQADLLSIGFMTKELPQNSYCSLAGLGNNQLKTNTIALANNYGVRVGLEDNIWFDNNKKILATNIKLLKRIKNIAEILDKNLLSSLDFGNSGFYNKKYRNSNIKNEETHYSSGV